MYLFLIVDNIIFRIRIKDIQNAIKITAATFTESNNNRVAMIKFKGPVGLENITRVYKEETNRKFEINQIEDTPGL